MSKADAGHTIPEDTRAISRRLIIHAGAVLAAGTISAVPAAVGATADQEPEWPEFREWYDLMLEQEGLYAPGNTIGDTGTDDDARWSEIDDKMRVLDHAMHSRQPKSVVNVAILAVLNLYWADKKARSHPARLLVLGTDLELHGGDFSRRSQATLKEAVIRLAVAGNLLPGVKIYGEGGNA